MSHDPAFIDMVEQLREEGGNRYPREAYAFVVAALGETVRQLPPDRLADDARRHLSGRELVVGALRFARARFGPLASTVFAEWGVHRSEDIGRIVFDLVAAGHLSARPEDTMADFVDGPDLLAVLAEPDPPAPVGGR